MTTARLFAAVYPPAALAERLHAACAPLRAAAPMVRWVPAAALHCTVRFYGDVPQARWGAIAEGLAQAAAGFDPLVADVRGLGAFPTWGRARVVWAGVVADPKFELLHHDIEVAAMALGFEVEGRVYRPHLTLGRVAREVPVEVRRAIRDAARGVRVREAFRLETVRLMASHAAPEGRRHELVAEHVLQRRH